MTENQKLSQKAWRERNKEKVRFKNKKQREKNPGYHKAWRKANPEKVKAYDRKQLLKRKYSLTIEQHAEMVAKQDGKCFICLETAQLYVDHDHETGITRKLLCVYCNTAIGYLRERVNIAIRVSNYIKTKGMSADDES